MSKPDILLTGAGGFIGSALAAGLITETNRLVCLDSSEQNLYQLQRKLPQLDFIMGDAADADLIQEILSRLQHTVVIHAAAYKHVPLLEQHVIAAARNNALATHQLATAARQTGAKRFLLISTDKAVNPKGVMGMTKRTAELFALSLASHDFCVNVLRLGNVLGSTGSVLPVFQEQASQNKPLTVTDPAAERFFYTIEETVEMIMSSLNAPESARLLIPARRTPTSISELARSISSRLEYVGLRPGEKLTEEFLHAYEHIVGSHGPLDIADTPSRHVDPAALTGAVRQRDVGAAHAILKQLCAP